MDLAILAYDYICNGGTTTLGGDARSPLMVVEARQRFFDILRDQQVTDVYMKLRPDNINKLTTYRELTKSFIAQATGYGIKVWANIESPYWAFDGDGSLLGNGIEWYGPSLVKQISDYNLAVPTDSRIYGIWFYVDYDVMIGGIGTPQTSWNRSAALAKSMKAVDASGMAFCYWLGWHNVTAGLSDLAAAVDMFELDGYAPTLAGVISRLNGRADAIEAYGKPFRISLSCDFHPSTPYTRYIASGWPVATQVDRLNYIKGYFNPQLVSQVSNYFGAHNAGFYQGVGVQSFKWGYNVAYPLAFVYTPPVVVPPIVPPTEPPVVPPVEEPVDGTLELRVGVLEDAVHELGAGLTEAWKKIEALEKKITTAVDLAALQEVRDNLQADITKLKDWRSKMQQANQ